VDEHAEPRLTKPLQSGLGSRARPLSGFRANRGPVIRAHAITILQPRLWAKGNRGSPCRLEQSNLVAMPAWTCPECGRSFHQRNQSHLCVPPLSKAEYFSTGKPFERPIFDAVAAHLTTLGPLKVEFVMVGIFFKRERTFAELRPMRKHMRLSIMLSRRLSSPRFARTWHGGGRSAYFIDLRAPGDVDDELRDWLTEAFAASPISAGPS
jgi:hypothetical protein